MEVVVIVIVVVVLIAAVSSGVKNMNANNEKLGAAAPTDVARVMGLNYLGGHPVAPAPLKLCNLVVSPRELAVEKGAQMTRLPLTEVMSVQVETEQEATRRLTATRMLAVGVFALAIPKKTPGSVLITFETDRGPLIFERTKANKATVLRQMGPAMAKINQVAASRPKPLPPAPAAPHGSVADELRSSPGSATRACSATRSSLRRSSVSSTAEYWRPPTPLV